MPGMSKRPGPAVRIRDDGTVRPVRFRADDLAAQNGYLMPQDQDLRILSSITPGQERQSAEHRNHEQADKTDEYERQA